MSPSPGPRPPSSPSPTVTGAHAVAHVSAALIAPREATVVLIRRPRHRPYPPGPCVVLAVARALPASSPHVRSLADPFSLGAAFPCMARLVVAAEPNQDGETPRVRQQVRRDPPTLFSLSLNQRGPPSILQRGPRFNTPAMGSDFTILFAGFDFLE
jgi:hypothetical protein